MLKRTGEIQTAFAGRRIRIEKHPVSNGHTSFDYEVVAVKNAVAVLPLLEEMGETFAILLCHHRYPIDQTNSVGPILEACAGVIEDTDEIGTMPNGVEAGGIFAAAVRELKEETGYVANKWSTCFGGFYSSPGITTERIFLYVARDLVPGEQQLELSEKGGIEVIKIRLQEAKRMAANGGILDLKTVVLLSLV